MITLSMAHLSPSLHYTIFSGEDYWIGFEKGMYAVLGVIKTLRQNFFVKKLKLGLATRMCQNL